MTTPKHRWQVQALCHAGTPDEKWVKIVEDTRAYCMGYLEGRRDIKPPRLAMRVIDVVANHVVALLNEDSTVSIGAVAGFPTARQYMNAATEAMAKARVLQEQERPAGHRAPDGREQAESGYGIRAPNGTIEGFVSITADGTQIRDPEGNRSAKI